MKKMFTSLRSLIQYHLLLKRAGATGPMISSYWMMALSMRQSVRSDLISNHKFMFSSYSRREKMLFSWALVTSVILVVFLGMMAFAYLEKLVYQSGLEQ